MNRKWFERIIWFFLLLIFSGASLYIGRSRANDTIDNAQATSVALQNSLNELLNITQPPDLSSELATAEAVNIILSTELALAWLPDPTATPTVGFTPTTVNLPFTPTPRTPTPTPTQVPNCYPTNIIEVVAVRNPRINLWNEKLDDIYKDEDGNRIQYSIGETLFVYEDAVETNDGDVFYEVFGPRGTGLFVGESGIKLFNADPDVLYCN